MTGEERENALHCLKVMIDEEVCEECKLYGTTGTDHCEADCVRVAIKALEQEPRKGHWIGHREHCENLGVMPSGLGVYEWCSNCDCGIDVREWHRNNYNFCPNCGADMREVEE